MQVQFSVEKSTFHLLVDGVRVTDGHLANDEGSSLDLHDLVYLGGDPARNTKVCSKPASLPICRPFPTCAHRNPLSSALFTRDTTFPRTASSVVSGMSKSTRKFCGNPRRATKLRHASTLGQRRAHTSTGAMSSPVRKHFTLQEDVNTSVDTMSSSVPDQPLYIGSQFVLVFELRPHRLAGLLFHANNHRTSLNVFLNETEVKL